MRYLVILCLVWIGVRDARAQPHRDSLFQSVTVYLSGASNVNRERFHDYWQPGYGLDAGARTPFYRGAVELGTSWHRYRSRDDGVPRFEAFWLYAGWGYSVPVTSWISTFTSVRLGNYLLWFDDDTPGLVRENELTLGVHGRLSLPINDALSLFAGGTYQKTFTMHRINLWYISAGATYTLRSPSWLKQFLR